MRWTILGSQGVIGGSLMKHLKSFNQDVFTPSRNLDGVFSNHLGHVIYAIGMTADFRNKPFETVEAHVSIVADILQKSSFDSFLYLSSTRVYSRSDNASEDSPLPVLTSDPSDLYNISKLMGESICLRDVRRTVRVARLSNVVGGDDLNSDNFFESLIRESLNGRICLKTALSSSKDYVLISDVVEMLCLIATEGRERIYNIASGISTKHSEWVDKISSITGCVVEVAPHAPVVNFAPININRLEVEFNFQPRSVLSALTNHFNRT